MRKKFLSVLLILAMTLSLLPATAWAANETLPNPVEGVITITKSGTYTVGPEVTDKIVVNAAKVTLSINGDVTNQIVVSATGSILDFNGSLAAGGAVGPVITNTGSLTIQGSGTISAAGKNYAIDNTGTLTIKDNITISGASESPSCIRSSGASSILNISGGQITGSTNPESAAGVAVSGGSLNVTGGTISGGIGISATDGKLTVTGGAVSGNTGIAASGGTLNVTGGEISGNTGIAAGGGTLTVGDGAKITGSDKGIEASSGILNVTGGVISGGTSGTGAGIVVGGGEANVAGGAVSGNTGIAVSGGTLTVGDGAKITGGSHGIKVLSGGLSVVGGEISGTNALYFEGSSETITASVSGGTFKGAVGSADLETGPKYFITGGTFSSNVDVKFLDPSKETAQQPGGAFQVIERGSPNQRIGVDVAQVASSKYYYPTLEAAVTAAGNGDTVKLVDYIEEKSRGNLVITKELTIELNVKENIGLLLGEDPITVSGESGKLKITGSETSSVSVRGSGPQTIVVEKGGTLTVDGATIINSGASSSAAIQVKDKSHVSINKGKVAAQGYGGVGVSIMQDGDLTINGGTVAAEEFSGIGVNIMQNGSLRMVDGTVTAQGESGIGVSIMRGVFTMEKGAVSAENKGGCAIYQSELGRVIINDGSITGQVGIVAHAGNIAFSNGTIQASGTGTITVNNGEYSSSVPAAGIVYDPSSSESQGLLAITNGNVLAAAGQKAIVFNPKDNNLITIRIPNETTAPFTGFFSSSIKEYVDKGTYPFEAKYREEGGDRYRYYKVFSEAVNAVMNSGAAGTVTGLAEGAPVYNIRFYLNEPDNVAPGTAAGTLFIQDKGSAKESYYVYYEGDEGKESGTWPTPDPTFNGYSFDGWFTNGGEQITLDGSDQSTSLDDFLKDQRDTDITLSARWTKDGVFEVDGAHYDTLKKAVDNANGHDITIEGAMPPLTEDITNIDVNILVKEDLKNLTLNLSGRKLGFKGNHGLVIQSPSGGEDALTVTITNGEIASDGTAVLIGQSGPAYVTVRGVKIAGINGVSVKSGTLTVESGAEITGNTDGVVVEGGTLTVRNGAIITGGGNGITVSGGGLTVEGGEISGAHALNFTGGSGTAIEAAVRGGTFKSTGGNNESVAVSGDNPRKFISGGAFSTSVNPEYLIDSLTYEAKAASGDAPYSYHAKIVDAVKAAGEKGTAKNTNGTPISVVTFDLNYVGATGKIGPAYVNEGKSENWPANPTRSGYVFDGWYTEKEDGYQVDSTYLFTKDTTVYAHWGKGAPYTITFNANGGKIDGKSTATAKTDKDGKLDKWPTAAFDNHTFDAWYTAQEGGDKVNLTYPFTKDTTVYAHWVFTVTFDGNGGKINGKPTATATTDEKGMLDKVPTPDRRTGYVFDGWYTLDKDAKPVNFSDPFTKNTTVSAHWTKEEGSSVYTITFDGNGGTFEGIGDTTMVDTGEDGILKKSDLPKATCSGYTFDDWYTATSGGKPVDFTYSFTKDTTVYAHWTKNQDPVYTITFDGNGGKIDGKSTATATTDKDGKLAKWPAKPTRSGYTFDDWYTAKTGGNKVPSDYRFTKDTTVYAHWTEDSSGGNSSGDTDTFYSIRISDARHGSVSSSHTSAKAGTKVTLTVIPETDYIAEVEVTPAKGSSPRLDRSGRLYTFTMPASNVTVDVKFTLQAAYNTFVPPQSQSQAQTNTKTSLPASAFTPVTQRPAAAMRDVPANSWAYPAAQWAYQNGYLDTAADGSFRLNGTVSHMQLWKIMAHWLGESALDDNSVSQWARKSGAARIGTASGAMTRQNMVEYLYQCYFLMGGDVSVSGNLIQYRDGQQITSGSARNAWLWAVNKGIISGTADGYLNPNGVLTRGEFAAILMRLCQSR